MSKKKREKRENMEHPNIQIQKTDNIYGQHTLTKGTQQHSGWNTGTDLLSLSPRDRLQGSQATHVLKLSHPLPSCAGGSCFPAGIF